MTHPLGPDTYIDDPDDTNDDGSDEQVSEMMDRFKLMNRLGDGAGSKTGPGPANLRYGRGHIPQDRRVINKIEPPNNLEKFRVPETGRDEKLRIPPNFLKEVDPDNINLLNKGPDSSDGGDDQYADDPAND